ncbi:MAG TPA: hypothetical protein VIX19_11650 [Terriglobales bacterium]
MPSAANIVIYQGDDFHAVVTVTDDDGSPADLTGYEAHAEIRVGPASQHPQPVTKIFTTIAGANIELEIPAAITVQLVGQYLWDLELISSVGIITTIIAGSVGVTPQITVTTPPPLTRRQTAEQNTPYSQA